MRYLSADDHSAIQEAIDGAHLAAVASEPQLQPFMMIRDRPDGSRLVVQGTVEETITPAPVGPPIAPVSPA